MILSIEGIDGSGKGTQAKALVNALQGRFERVELVSFPRYGQSKGALLVQEYLNGRIYGATTDVLGPAMFFALDRLEALPFLMQYANSDAVCLVVDRYVASNIAHQTCKELNLQVRRAYQDEIFRIEHEILGIPKPNATIIFNIDPLLAQDRVLMKDARAYTSESQDIHERNLGHLQNAATCYQELVERDFYENVFQFTISSEELPEAVTSRVVRSLTTFLERG